MGAVTFRLTSKDRDIARPTRLALICLSRYGILLDRTQNSAVRNTSVPAVLAILMSNQL